MANMYRQSRHPLIRWWWQNDRLIILLTLMLMLLGCIIVATASVAAAKTYGVGQYYFAVRQYIFVALAIAVMLTLTLFKIEGIKRLGALLFTLAFVGLIATFFMGVDVKGASRWIDIAGQRIQPSEFMKPAFVILTATILSLPKRGELLRFGISLALMAVVAGLLLLQPDFGMFLLMGSVWFSQVFLAGISLRFLIPLVFLGLGTIAGAYFSLEHVRVRLNKFINPETSDTYQVDKAQEALLSGHLWGRGAGEGVVKHALPDAHTDFIFAVLSEEFGIVSGLVLLAVYGIIIFRGFQVVIGQGSMFRLVAGGGLLTMLALQVMINVGVAINMLPTTGMTLPFISYGGSAMMSMALSMGFLLAILRRRR